MKRLEIRFCRKRRKRGWLGLDLGFANKIKIFSFFFNKKRTGYFGKEAKLYRNKGMKTLAGTSVVSRNTVCFVCLFILFCFVLFVCLFVFLKGLRSFRLCIMFYQAMLCLVFYTSVFEIMIVVYSFLFFKKIKGI